MVKSAASAASPTTWKLHGSTPAGRRPLAEPSSGRSPRLPEDQNPGIHWSLAVPGRPHAEPLSAGPPEFLDFGLRGGCASSRLDHGLKVELFS